jgi:hypothetical protein
VIPTGQHLKDLIEEIATWSLDDRRKYLADIEKAYGPDDVGRLKDALNDFWEKKRK